MSVTQVQRWVTTVLTVAVVGHFSAGLVLAAVLIQHSSRAGDNLSGAIGLNVLAALTALGLVVAVRAIHRRRLLSPWLALGLLEGALGFWLTFAR